ADGGDPIASTPEEYAANMQREEDKWAAVIKKLGLKIEEHLARDPASGTTTSTYSDGVVVGRDHEGDGSAGRRAMAVDARFRPPRGPHAYPRLRDDARGSDGGVRQELGAGVTASARRADRQVESAAWTACGGLVRDERWR